jgi:hypothetical protein
MHRAAGSQQFDASWHLSPICAQDGITCWHTRPRRGTEIASVFYSLLETAKLLNVDPARYLRDAALADARGEVLLPGSCLADPHAAPATITGRREDGVAQDVTNDRLAPGPR